MLHEKNVKKGTYKALEAVVLEATHLIWNKSINW